MGMKKGYQRVQGRENAFVTTTWRRIRGKFDTQNEHRVLGTIDHFTETHDPQDNSPAQSKLFDCWQYVEQDAWLPSVFTYLVHKAQACLLLV